MIKFKRVDLSNHDFSYVEKILDYENEVCEVAIKALNDFDDMDFFTYLPEDQKLEKDYDFRMGGLLSSSHSIASKFLFDKCKSHALIFDDVMASPSDIAREKSISRVVIRDNDIFHIIDKGSIDSMSVITTLLTKTSVPWHFVCLVTSQTNAFFVEGTDVENESDLLASYVDAIVIGAFDGEGYLFIQRRS